MLDMLFIQDLKEQRVSMRVFISTLQTLISIAPCSQIFEHQSLDDEDSDEGEEEQEEGTASVEEVIQQPQASTSTPFQGIDEMSTFSWP